jgi:hypothetical protein
MSKLNKLIQKFLARPGEVRFEDVSYILKAFGYVEVRSRVVIIPLKIWKEMLLLFQRKEVS